MDNFKSISVDEEKKEVTFGAGVTFDDLIKELYKHELALSNLPSITSMNVVGAVVTG